MRRLAVVLSLALVLLSAAPAFAVITATAQTCQNTASVGVPGFASVSCTLPGTTTAGATMVCGVTWDSPTEGVFASITDGHHTYTLRSTTFGTHDSFSGKIADSINITAQGTMNITANFSPNVNNSSIACQEFTNIAAFDLGSVGVQTGIGTGTDAITSGTTGTRAQANEVLVGHCVATNASRTFTQGTGYTVSQQIVNWATLEYEVVSAAGTQAATCTSNLTGTNSVTSIADYEDVVAGGGGGARRRDNMFMFGGTE